MKRRMQVLRLKSHYSVVSLSLCLSKSLLFIRQNSTSSYKAAFTERSQAQMSRLPLLSVCQDSNGKETKNVVSWGCIEQLFEGVGMGQHLQSILMHS